MVLNGHGVVYNGDVIGIDASYYREYIIEKVWKINDKIKNSSLIRWFTN